MRASHILVKHQGSRRTASWKDQDGVRIKTRTKVRYVLLCPAIPLSPFLCSDKEPTTGGARRGAHALRRVASMTQQQVHSASKEPYPLFGCSCVRTECTKKSKTPGRRDSISEIDRQLFMHSALPSRIIRSGTTRTYSRRRKNRAKKILFGARSLRSISFRVQRNRRRPADRCLAACRVEQVGLRWTLAGLFMAWLRFSFSFSFLMDEDYVSYTTIFSSCAETKLPNIKTCRGCTYSSLHATNYQ